jgi:hypothetical protein
MNALLIYPKFPDTFWSFSYALRFIGNQNDLKKDLLPALIQWRKDKKEGTQKPDANDSNGYTAAPGVFARLPEAGHSGNRKIPILVSVDVDPIATAGAAAVGRYPGNLRLPPPQNLRITRFLKTGYRRRIAKWEPLRICRVGLKL